ncbi:MAG: bifunctional lysylphosphatidylglycerol flippase/synthetase MprF [Anaerolineales bacterium]|nr:bifunctional lysylphosphatidylglycerol flippase/synthetase MprF [Anaerolineales bacterium]
MKFKFNLSAELLVHLIASLTALMGVINVLSAVTPPVHERLKILLTFLPFMVSRGGHLASALLGFALIILSVGLWRRKKQAWWLAFILLIASIVTHLTKGLDYEEATFAALVSGLLLYARPQFHALSDRPSIRQGALFTLAALIFTVIYGVAGFYLLDRHYSVSFGFWAALRQTLIMLVEFYNPGVQPITGFGRYFIDSIYIVGIATIGFGLFMLLRPVLIRHPATEEERQRAWEIIKTHGHTPLARMALFDDKLFFFSQAGSVISYVLSNRVALALGDPIGPVEDFENALNEFKALCKSNDWLTAFYQTLPAQLERYKQAKFDAIKIGHEAVVNLETFTLEGSVNKTLRNSFNKMLKLGYRADVIQPPYSARMLRELNLISEEWLTSKALSEMRFSLGWFDEAYLNSCPILLVRDREGFIEAFANILPEFQANEVALDLMRHRQVVESGLMDFLFVSLFQWAQQQGYASFNLGLSAFTQSQENPQDPAAERTLNYLYSNLNRFYNFSGLHSFKEKFHPTWEPRYLTYPGTINLPSVGAALIQANLGRTFSLWR